MSDEENSAGPSVKPNKNPSPKQRWRGADDEVLHILDIPYYSEDKFGGFIDDFTEKQIFEKFEEIFEAIDVQNNQEPEPCDHLRMPMLEA